MKHFLRLALLAAALVFPSLAQAATCFWVGGTGNYDNINLASWSSSSGGSATTCAATGGIPKNAGDIATFDGSSGGGTVTVCGTLLANCPTSSGLLSLAQITMGAFTGTLDFATNDPNVTLTTAFSGTGTGSRTLNMGDGNWSMTAASGTPWDCSTTTNFTLNANSSTLDFAATPTTTRTINLGSKTYNNVSITNASANSFANIFSTGSPTIAGAFSLTNVRLVRFSGGLTYTITGAFTYNGTSTTQAILFTDGTVSTFSVGAANTLSWLTIQNITKSGAGSIACTNCFDAGSNTSVSITQPTSGGRIIGG